MATQNQSGDKTPATQEPVPAPATGAAHVAPPVVPVTDPDPVPPAPPVEETPEPVTADRMETYEATRPNGERIRITRNIETGEQSVEVLEGPADD